MAGRPPRASSGRCARATAGWCRRLGRPFSRLLVRTKGELLLFSHTLKRWWSAALPLLRRGRRRRIRALGRRFVARGAEFAVGAPVRPFARIGEPLADEMQQIAVLRHAAKIPLRVKLVARLVVALFGVIGGERFPALDPAVHEIVAGLEADRGHALLGE